MGFCCASASDARSTKDSNHDHFTGHLLSLFALWRARPDSCLALDSDFRFAATSEMRRYRKQSYASPVTYECGLITSYNAPRRGVLMLTKLRSRPDLLLLLSLLLAIL